MTTEASSMNQFNELLSENDKVVVIFAAAWCAPCLGIKPFWDELEKEHSGLKFVSVDVDDNEDCAQHYNVEAMPTFKFFHNGADQTQLTVMGDDKKTIVEKLEEFSAL